MRLDSADGVGAVAVVTGGAGGIGYAICERLSLDGFAVAILDIRVDEARRAALSLAGPAASYSCDVADYRQVESALGNLQDAFGRIDVLVNNAAVVADLHRAPFDEIPEAQWDRMLAVNLKGAWNCCRSVAPTLRSQRSGSIVNISSDLVSSGVVGFAHYTSSKGGLNALTRVLATELGPFDVRVNAVAPGFTLTEGALQDPGDAQARSIERRAISRAEVPADVVGAVAWLASGDSTFITGQVITVNGGYVY